LAGCWQDAADNYAADGQLEPALKCCLDGRLWNHGLLLLDNLQQQLKNAANSDLSASASSSSSTGKLAERRSRYAQACAASLHGLGQRQEMLRFMQLLPDRKQRTFMINRGLVADLAAKLEETRSWQEVAAMCEEAGDLAKAAEMHAARGKGLPAAQLLLRQARVLLLWPEAAKLPAGAAPQQALQLLLKASQGLAEAAAEHAVPCTTTAAAAAELSVLSGLAKGFATPQQALDWSSQCSAAASTLNDSEATTAAYLRLLAAVQGFLHALWLAAGTHTRSSSSSAAPHLATQLWQQWQQLQQVLLPVFKALDASLRTSQPLSIEQLQLLCACERYMCVRAGSSTAAFRTAERGSMLWVQERTSAPTGVAAAGAVDDGAFLDPAAGGSSSSSSSEATVQVNVATMLMRVRAYWQWWLAAKGAQLAGYLHTQFVKLHESGCSTTGSSSSSSNGGCTADGVHMLLHSWEASHTAATAAAAAQCCRC
jgi:hypothetical protein